MPSFLHLRYAGKIKQFKWPVEPHAALSAIATAFLIKPESIVGFKDKEGKLHDINELYKNPEEANKQSFMLVVQGEEKKVLQDSPIRQIRNMANFGDLTPETPTQTQEVSLMLISNFPEFERTFLQNNGNSMSIIFVLNKKQQLEEVTSKVSSLVNQYSERFEFYNYICKGANDNVNVMSSAFPLVLVYSGGKRLMEIPLGSNLKTLTNLLERVQPSDNKGAQEVIKARPASSTPKNNKTEMILNHIEELFEQNDITGLEYYFLKSGVLEKRDDVLEILERYLKYREVDQLKQDIREFTKESKQATPQYSNSKHIQSKSTGFHQPMKQNFMRPETSAGKSKSRNKEISSVQERFIQIIAELERSSYLTEHSASLIKSLILEENHEVIRVLNAYEADVFDEQELSFRLVQLAEKLSPYIVRPKSPLPKKDELIRLVNNLVRKRLKDDNHLLMLNKLILEGDELLYSTFEVFESDRDEEDLLDTLIRIVNRYKRSGRFGNNLYASPFYSSQKIPLVDNDQELIKERRSERPGSQGTISYFLESRTKSKSREQSIDRSIQSRKETREHSLDRGYSRKEARDRDRDQSFDRSLHSRKEFSPVSMTHELSVDLSEALKGVTAIKNLPSDEYGIVFWMVRNKSSLIKDVINDHGGLEAIERAVPSILLLANKELSTNLKDRFDEKQRLYINESKKIRNSATFAVFQCFKYDQDLEGLLKSLEEIVKNMPKSEFPSRKPSRNQEEIAQAIKQIVSVQKKEVKEFLAPHQNLHADLAVIREEDKASSKVGSQNKLSTENEKAIIETSIHNVSTTVTVVKNGHAATNGAEAKTGEQPTRTSVSKYTPLINRDTRADSFKGMFQLKLISSDNPNVTGTPVRDPANKGGDSANVKTELQESETKNSLDAHLNVIIPPKNEVNPFIQSFIDQFYESQGNSVEHFEQFKSVLAQFDWLNSEDISKLEALYENFYYELFEIIYTYEGNKDLKELERRLKEDILTVDLDNISIASASPRERKRMAAYHSFKALLQNLRNENSISEKQYKTYLYLYTEEDVTILAAYEVYQYTNDIPDFIDTLLLIEKVQYFKNESKYFEDISNFNDVVEYQLKIIFTLKKYLNTETRAILEKIIRSGDTTVHQIYQDHKKNKDNKNKNNLIHKLVNFAEENAEIVKNYEMSIAQRQLISEQKNVKRREQIESFEGSKMLPEVKYYDLLYDCIDNDEELLHSIFEIYDYNKDKNEFIENITLVYKFLYKRHIFNILQKNKEKMGWTDAVVENLINMINRKDKSILGPMEFYYATKDEDEFLETVQLLIQAQNKKAALGKK